MLMLLSQHMSCSCTASYPTCLPSLLRVLVSVAAEGSNDFKAKAGSCDAVFA